MYLLQDFSDPLKARADCDMQTAKLGWLQKPFLNSVW
jgi:hypothetical protein